MSRSRWKVPMPKVEPKPGMADFVIAMKTDTGIRMEYIGQLPKDIANDLFVAACRQSGAKKGGAA